MSTDARMAEVMRASYGRLLAILATSAGDILAAEDALSDAFAKAVIHWPQDMPKNPEAWLLTVARNRLTDVRRRDARIEFRDEMPDLQRGAEAPRASRTGVRVGRRVSRLPRLLARQERAAHDHGRPAR